MCLLTTAKSSVMRNVFLNTPGMIEDVYKHNSDGIGVMYAAVRGLTVHKTLPKDAAQARKFIEKLPNDDRMVALHWRMRTHGDINLDNCHPYPVSEGVALMHNGILHTDNHGDRTKSDTWHFIKDYLKGLSADTMHSEGFLNLVGDFIDANRFAIMSADGRLSVVNKDQGVEAKDIWFSNTYAWSPEMLIPNYSPSRDNLMDDQVNWRINRNKIARDVCMPARTGENSIDAEFLCESIDEAMAECEAEALTPCIKENYEYTIAYLFAEYVFTAAENVADDDLDPASAAIRALVVGGNTGSLLKLMREDRTERMAQRISEAAMWYCDYHPTGFTFTTATCTLFSKY